MTASINGLSCAVSRSGISSLQPLTTILDYIRWGASRFNEAGLFFGHGTDNAIDEAAALVLHALHLPQDLHASWFQSRLTEEERDRVVELIRQRIEKRLPLPYLIGEAWFAGLKFAVNPHVLIPRSPMAELIENGFSPWLDPERINRVLDLCCGSGCIGIATAVSLPGCQVDLVDISADALAVCEENIQTHGLAGQAHAIQSDLFQSLGDQRYDLIISNPPYVGEEEMALLPPEYRHEPALALHAEEDGLQIVKRILREAPKYLAPQGILVVEVGNSATLLQEIYPDIPFLWLEFERGGSGVFLLSAGDLAQYANNI
ncbi:MAG: 50S ribosomal protein L3 N(5)-glutamine methyltransferase [Candidatus Thiodiazotropha sp. (ex Monitilora ramsayi)]|nr:50S ribosomal protein L3 N(5)-glutamine methyltransferase [Candidatus Thiodiazotropha sp. (ex Monitilora ramsayi)]